MTLRRAPLPRRILRARHVRALRRALGLLLWATVAPSLALGQADDAWLRVPNALAPRGPFSARIADVWWFLLVIATAVFVIVCVLFAIAMIRRGEEITDGGETHDERAYPWLVTGSVLTAITLLVTSVVTFTTMRALADPATPATHTFEIVGHQWWWEIRYDGETIGANELHVPVGEAVQLELRSDDVIHSLWVPELAAKRDLVPGHPTSMWLQADEAGTHRAVCAEFCGVQHAKMGMLVVAEPAERFEAWLERVRSDAAPPEGESAEAGAAVFRETGCAGCHTIRGAGAGGRRGPDLTHLAGRRTLAAAHLPNTRGHLGGWIVDPQSTKPGNLMPPQDVAGEDLQALLDYLGGLE